MKWEEIEKLNELQLRESIGSELENLKKRHETVLAERKRIKESISESKDIQSLIRKLNELDKYLKESISHVSSAYTGFFERASDENTVTQVKILENLNLNLEKIRIAFRKIIRHLKDDKRSINKVLRWIEDTEDLLKTTSGFRRYFHYNPINMVTGRKRLMGSERIKKVFQNELFSCGTLSRDMEKELEIGEQDFQAIEQSTKIVYNIGVQIKRNLDLWRMSPNLKNKSKYLSIIATILSLLKELINLLHELAEDEQFIEVTGIRIIKLQRNDLAVLNSIIQKLPQKT